MPDDEKPLNRRSFFRDGLFEMLKPLAHPISRRIAPIERLAEQFTQFDEMGSPRPAPAWCAVP